MMMTFLAVIGGTTLAILALVALLFLIGWLLPDPPARYQLPPRPRWRKTWATDYDHPGSQR